MKSDANFLAVTSACALWLVALAALATSPAADPVAGRGVAKVVALSGEAKSGARALKIGDNVAEGEELASGRGSYATIEFTDATVVRLTPESRLRIEAHRASAALTDVETRLRLGAGALEASAAAQPAPNITVVSTLGSVEVRGTAFRVRVGNESMFVEVLEGRAAVSGAAGALVAVDAGFGTRVSPNEAPLAPVELLGAPDISRVAELQQRPVVRLRFASLAGAQRYRIVAAADRDLREVLVENTQRRPDARMVELHDGEYYFGVRAIDELGLQGAEARGRFRLKARPLPPLPQAPEPDAVMEPGDVVFSWVAVQAASSYRFQLAADEAFNAPLASRDGLLTREFEVENLAAGRYYWRVATVIAGDDQGPFGDPQVFTLQAPAPQLPQ